MNEKEALQNIRNLTKHLDNSDDRLVDTFRLVIIALNKQTPKKPDYEGDGYDRKGNMIYDTWVCPNCGEEYEVDYDDYKYCPNCGQRLDWEENHAESC